MTSMELVASLHYYLFVRAYLTYRDRTDDDDDSSTSQSVSRLWLGIVAVLA